MLDFSEFDSWPADIDINVPGEWGNERLMAVYAACAAARHPDANPLELLIVDLFRQNFRDAVLAPRLDQEMDEGLAEIQGEGDDVVPPT